MLERSSAVPAPAAGRPGSWHASIAVLRARWHARCARRQERRALEELGAALADSCAHGGPAVRRACTDVAAHGARVTALESATAASLEEDRRDYAAASPWLRPLVIGRGVATRCLLRDQLRRTRQDRAAACGVLGAAALEEGLAVEGPAGPWALAAREARARAAAAAAEEEPNLAPLGGAVLPVVARHVARETAALGRPLLHEVRARVFPRVPALAGLAVGWWVASTFTDSGFSATLHALGIGSGPRRAVSTETLHAMEFWLPVVAAATCSYASGRLGVLVRARYAPTRQDAAASSTTMGS